MKKILNRVLNYIFKTPCFLELSGIIRLSFLQVVLALVQVAKIELCRRILQSLLSLRGNILLQEIIGLIFIEVVCAGIIWLEGKNAARIQGKILKQLMNHVLGKNGRLISWSKCDMGVNDRFTMAEGDCERYVDSVIEKANLFSDFVIVPCYIVYGCSINIPITIFITIVSLFLSVINRKNKAKLYSYNEEYNERYGYWVNFLWKAVDNLEVIKVFLNKEKILIEQKRRNEQVDDTSNKSLVTYLNMCLVEESSDIIFTLLILCFSFVAIIKKIILPSDILAMVQALSNVQKVIFALPEKLVQLYELKSIASRIYQYENIEEDNAIESDVEDFNQLTVRNLSFAYENQEILHNINYTFEKGQFYILVGKSGCGKSTLLKAFAKLIPVEGEIIWNEKSLSQIHRHNLYQKLTYRSQNQVFLEDTIKENICLQGRWSEEQYKRILEASYVKDIFDKNKIDDSEQLTFRGAPLSSGECQMVSLAGVLYEPKDIILLDEAFSAIDPAKEQVFFDELRLLVDAGKTVILVSHRLTNLEKADQIIYMEDGCICESGKVSELLMLRGKFFAWYEISKERSSQ